MKLSILLFFLSLYFKTAGQASDKSRFLPFTIDTSLNSTLAKAKLNSGFNLPMVADGFWFFMNQEDYKEYFGENDPIMFFDTLQTYTDLVCDCMIKKDTIYLQGGIGYDGAIGFDLRIVGKLFNGRIFLAGTGYKTNESAEYLREILFNSVRQSLKIQSLDSLNFDKNMIGELFMESEEYYEKGKQIPDKLYMKVLFACKLDDVIVL